MIMAFLVLIAGLLLSGTAAYYSIIGLLAIFPGAVVPIALMGSSLEFAKLVAASWLYRNWDIAPKILKGYFIFAIIVLMFITSLGTFGYLSKVHLESSIGVADNSLEIARIEQQIAAEQRKVGNAQRSLESLDSVVDKAFLDGARIRNQQKTERTALNSVIESSDAKIEQLTTDLVPLRRSNIESEAKIGPLKYIAELIYGKDEAANYFDSAVRFVIILIVLVFDPLAVLLLIAANISFSQPKKKEDEVEPKEPKPKKPNYIVEKIETVQAKRKKKKKVASAPEVEYNKGMGKSIYNFMMRDDFGITHTDKVEDNEPTRKVKEKHND
jgi:flagellar basal body-associated protein FliL